LLLKGTRRIITCLRVQEETRFWSREMYFSGHKTCAMSNKIRQSWEKIKTWVQEENRFWSREIMCFFWA
jgi:hypothetical protein